MYRTQVIGIILVIAGLITHYVNPKGLWATLSLMLGAFLWWNGWVAKVNENRNFAVLG